jgi:hypothetical protein
VLDHDFPSDAKGVAIPYGIYDFCRNKGFVNLGTSRDTAEFAVASICKWWQMIGSLKYPNADHLLILADCGGSNAYRTRLWKHQLQVAFADRFKLCVKVCHYPSKELRLFNVNVPRETRIYGELSPACLIDPVICAETVEAAVAPTVVRSPSAIICSAISL